MFCCANVHIFFEIQKIHQDKVVLMDFIISTSKSIDYNK